MICGAGRSSMGYLVLSIVSRFAGGSQLHPRDHEIPALPVGFSWYIIGNRRDLEHHPKVGASWEGYAVEEVLKALRPDDAYYWATHQGAEIDLLLFKRGRRIGVECK